MNKFLAAYAVSLILFGLAISFSLILPYYLAARELAKKYSKPKNGKNENKNT